MANVTIVDWSTAGIDTSQRPVLQYKLVAEGVKRSGANITYKVHTYIRLRDTYSTTWDQIRAWKFSVRDDSTNTYTLKQSGTTAYGNKGTAPEGNSTSSNYRTYHNLSDTHYVANTSGGAINFDYRVYADPSSVDTGWRSDTIPAGSVPNYVNPSKPSIQFTDGTNVIDAVYAPGSSYKLYTSGGGGGSTAVASRQIQYRKNGGSWSTLTHTGSAAYKSSTISIPTSPQSGTLEARARVRDKNGTYSSYSTIMKRTYKPLLPGASTGLKFTLTTAGEDTVHGTYKLSWTAPSSKGHGLSSYKVTMKRGSTVLNTSTATSTSLNYIPTNWGAKEGDTVTFTVQSIGILSLGGGSASISYTFAITDFIYVSENAGAFVKCKGYLVDSTGAEEFKAPDVAIIK